MTDKTSSPVHSLTGALAGISAFTIWGLLSLLWIPLKEIPEMQILAYRILFSVLVMLPMVYFLKKSKPILDAIRNPNALKFIIINALLIGGNWYLYIWAVLQNMIIEISLGFFMTPLVNVLLGRILFKEYMTRLQIIAICIAFASVLWSVIAYGIFPYLSVALALLYSLYCLTRKIAPIDPFTITFLESAFLLPVVVIWYIVTYSQIEVHFFSFSTNEQLLLLFSGIATSVPLILFGYAAQHLQLSTLGILDYITPSITFLVGIFIMGEKLSTDTLITFICIWTALALYLYSTIKTRNTHSRAVQTYQDKAPKRTKRLKDK